MKATSKENPCHLKHVNLLQCKHMKWSDFNLAGRSLLVLECSKTRLKHIYVTLWSTKVQDSRWQEDAKGAMINLISACSTMFNTSEIANKHGGMQWSVVHPPSSSAMPFVSSPALKLLSSPWRVPQRRKEPHRPEEHAERVEPVRSREIDLLPWTYVIIYTLWWCKGKC